jgi:HD-like signal output (HDOD) protein
MTAVQEGAVSNSHQEHLDFWVNRLSKQEMPIFARTAQHITNVVARDYSSVAELSRGILQDASMTARLLRMANSAYYNPHSHSINTITRAVMVLGFESVRSMCLSFALIENLLKGAHRERAYQEMARCFHAAVQAKRIAAQVHDESPEEIFIAALLYRLGNIAFWCFGGELADRLEEAMLKPGYTQALAEREVLGFRLEELTARLSEEWHLSRLLRMALESPGGGESRVSHIVFGHKLASSAERGWDSAEVKRLIGKLAERLKISTEAATEVVHASVKEAAEIVDEYGGAKKVRRLIPLPPETAAPEPGPTAPESAFPEPDRLLQFKILHELSSLLLNKQLDINLLFSILLEGIFRGVGMDRVLFALLTPDRRQLRGKFGLGWKNDQLTKEFVVDAIPPGANIFSYSLDKRQPLWVTADPPAELARLLTSQSTRLLGRSPFFLMAIAVKDRPIGVIYADRQPSGRELDEESYTSFRYFCQQADINLSYVAQ